MRVYHFTCSRYGLEALRKRRLKVSRIQSLNDPFEFLAVSLTESNLRQALLNVKRDLAQTKGLICFSETWRSPLMWAHYAADHTGVCLGFDIPDDRVHAVKYVARRDDPPPPKDMLTQEFAQGLFLKKFSHWKYEQEYRAVVALSDCQKDDGLYFVPFSDELALRQVIVGSESKFQREDIESAVGGIRDVEMFKARPAFRTFRIVRQQRKDLW